MAVVLRNGSQRAPGDGSNPSGPSHAAGARVATGAIPPVSRAGGQRV